MSWANIIDQKLPGKTKKQLVTLLVRVDPGSQEIIKTHRRSLLEHTYLSFTLDLLSNFPVNNNKFLLIRIVSVTFRKYTLYIHFLSLSSFLINAISGKITSTSSISHPDQTTHKNAPPSPPQSDKNKERTKYKLLF